MLEMTIQEYKKIEGPSGKYGAIRTICKQKHTHASKKEATRCDELTLLLKSHIITKFKQQTKFVLQKAFWSDHEKIRPICYLADFTYYEKGDYIVEDVKGKRTDVYLLKKKLLLKKLSRRKRCRFIET